MRFQCSEGLLLVETPLVHLRVRWRPTPTAEERMVAGRPLWRPVAPEFRLVAPETSSAGSLSAAEALTTTDREHLSAKAAAFTAFRAELPAAIASAVERFPCHQWLLMVLLDRQPALLDLVAANPVLAYCLANNDQFRGTRPGVSIALALGHSRQRQRQLAEWLGFPGTEAVVRLLRRVPPEAASPSLLRRLRAALQSEETLVSQLAHVPVLNTGVLELAVHARMHPLITPKLLLTVGGRAEELSMGHLADQLGSALALRQQLGIGAPVSPFSTPGQITRFMQRMDAAYQARQRAQAEARAEQERLARVIDEQRRVRRVVRRPPPDKPRPFPPPPLPGALAILAVETPQALVEEGRLQSNCVATYLPGVLNGTCYFYRVTAPERATLMIVPTVDGGWRRGDLKGPRNRRVGAHTTQIVDAWLARHRLSIT